jgi:hypothetical protein
VIPITDAKVTRLITIVFFHGFNDLPGWAAAPKTGLELANYPSERANLSSCPLVRDKVSHHAWGKVPK